MFFTYILQSEKSSRYYIGSTENLDKRLIIHNSGKVKSTRNKGPWVLKYFEQFKTRTEAVRRELEIKGYKGGNSFKELMVRASR